MGALRLMVALAVSVTITGGLALAMAFWAELGTPPKPPKPAPTVLERPIVRPPPPKAQPTERPANPRAVETTRAALPALDLPSAIQVPVYTTSAPAEAAVVHAPMERRELALSPNAILTEDLVDEPPRPLLRAPLRYPKEAEAQGLTGEVEARLLLDADGAVLQIQILSAPSVFDEAAKASLSTWRFTPATFHGQRLKAWVRQRVRFTLQ